MLVSIITTTHSTIWLLEKNIDNIDAVLVSDINCVYVSLRAENNKISNTHSDVIWH